MTKPNQKTPKLGSGRAKFPANGLVPHALSAEKLRLVIAICERVASGDRITQVLGPHRPEGWPTWNTFAKWQTEFPAVRDMYSAAREISAQTLEDRALAVAEGLLAPEADYTGTYVQGAGKAMEQLRWSAERRDPGRFGSKATTSTVVPIQINTTLDLGQPGGGRSIDVGNPFRYVAEVEVPPAVEAPPASDPEPEEELDPGKERDAPVPGPDPEGGLPPGAERFGLTEWPVSTSPRQRGGRRKPKGLDPRTGEPWDDPKAHANRTGHRTPEGYAKERIAELKAARKAKGLKPEEKDPDPKG